MNQIQQLDTKEDCDDIFQCQQNYNQQNFQKEQLSEYENMSSQLTQNKIAQEQQQQLITDQNFLSNSAQKNFAQAFHRINSPQFNLKIKSLKPVLRDEENIKDSEQSFLSEQQSYQCSQKDKKHQNDQYNLVLRQFSVRNCPEKCDNVTNTPQSIFSSQVEQVSNEQTLKKQDFNDEFKANEDYSKIKKKNLKQNKQNEHYQVEIQRIQQLKQNLKNSNENLSSLQNKNSEQSQNSLFSYKSILNSKRINYFRDTIIKQSGLTNKRYSQVQPINEQNNEDEKKVYIYQNWSIVNHLNIILKAKQKLLSLITQRLESVTPFQHYLIGDSSDIFNQDDTKQNANFLSKINSFTLDPGSAIVIGSKIFISLLILFNLIYLPIVFGFNFQGQTEITIIMCFSMLFYIFEIILGFKIAYYEMGELVSDPFKIRKKYMRDQFLIDLLACLSLLIGLQYKFMILLTLVKGKSLTQYLWDIDNHFFLYERFHAAWVLIKLFGFISIMGHYFACIFHYAAMIQNDNPNVVTWIQVLDLQDSTWSLRYNYSVYFSFITCITIGYGDITPKNVIERNVVIIISLISTGFFSYSINTIGTIFQTQFQNIQKKKEMRFDAIIYMRERHIHKHLQLRVLKYIDYINDMKLISPDRGLVVINQISKDLQSLLFKDFYGKILKQNKNFNLNYSSQTLEKLSLKMKEKIYGPGEIIFEQKEQDLKIFYLIKGEIEYYIHNKDGNKQSEYISIAKTDKSMFFGYKGFISGIPREMTCRSVNVTHVFYCSREDLITVLKEDPQDYEQFCKIRDEYLLYTNSLGEQCFSCKQYGHAISNCHLIHFVRSKELLMQKNNYSQNQRRVSFQRKKQKYQALLNLQLTVFQGVKLKLKTIMKIRQQYISDEIIEQIAIQDLSTGKSYKNEYPSIQLKDKEFIIVESDEINEESSQSLSEDSEDISVNTNISYQDRQNYQNIFFQISKSSEFLTSKNKNSNQKNKNKRKNQSKIQFEFNNSLPPVSNSYSDFSIQSQENDNSQKLIEQNPKPSFLQAETIKCQKQQQKSLVKLNMQKSQVSEKDLHSLLELEQKYIFQNKKKQIKKQHKSIDELNSISNQNHKEKSQNEILVINDQNKIHNNEFKQAQLKAKKFSEIEKYQNDNKDDINDIHKDAQYSSNQQVFKQILQQQIGANKNEQEFGIHDFDSLKEFSRYFPHNNITVVCFNFKQHLTKKNLLKKKILNHSEEILAKLKFKSISGLHSLLIKNKKKQFAEVN
ncbi:hypothetical protein ABPG72_005190 [Tetrahymena utriculariae]